MHSREALDGAGDKDVAALRRARAADAGLAGGQEFDAGAARQAQALLGHLAFDELGEWLAREEIA